MTLNLCLIFLRSIVNSILSYQRSAVTALIDAEKTFCLRQADAPLFLKSFTPAITPSTFGRV